MSKSKDPFFLTTFFIQQELKLLYDLGQVPSLSGLNVLIKGVGLDGESVPVSTLLVRLP